MQNRRSFLKISAGIFPSLIAISSRSFAENGGLKPASIQDTSPISEKLLYSTIRLHDTSSVGTGFFFQLLKGSEKSLPVIVTNRHVVEKMGACSFSVHKDSNGSAHKTDVVDITIQNIQTRLVMHPTEDLAIIPIGDIIQRQAEINTPLYIAWMDNTIIPTNHILESLNPLEEVLTVGFPGNFYDTLHNIPLFHSGHTSTPPNMPFATDYDEGRRHSSRTFLVDLATMPGSSGSPVFIFNENGYSDRKGNHFLGGQRLLLIGVVFGVANQEVRGKVKIQSIPNETGEEVLSIPVNVGACLLADQIFGFEDVLIGRGLTPPDGYQRRT
jgi:hypothetical protein